MCHVIMAKSRRIAKMYNQIEMSVRITNVLSWTFCGIIVLYYTLYYIENAHIHLMYVCTSIHAYPHRYERKYWLHCRNLIHTRKRAHFHVHISKQLGICFYGCTYTNVKCNESTKDLKVCKRVTVRFSQKKELCVWVCVCKCMWMSVITKLTLNGCGLAGN